MIKDWNNEEACIIAAQNAERERIERGILREEGIEEGKNQLLKE